jgi:SAM-dependent methyltransferase
MLKEDISDEQRIKQHRAVWAVRPELRSVYQEWFAQLWCSLEGRRPVVEIGAGPGFFKDNFPELIATDVISGPNLDIVCGANPLPFQSGSLGGVVMLDVLHHLPEPLEFLNEAGRVLRPGGRLVMIEPWITCPSYLLYRYFHDEDCSLRIDIRQPFGRSEKKAFDGNAAIPFKVLKQVSPENSSLHLLRADPFIALPYLATLGFKSARPIPQTIIDIARFGERLLSPVRKLLATRILIIWERAGHIHGPLN